MCELYCHFDVHTYGGSRAENVQVIGTKKCLLIEKVCLIQRNYTLCIFRQDSINLFDEFKTLLVLMLTDILGNWFGPIMNNIHDIPT